MTGRPAGDQRTTRSTTSSSTAASPTKEPASGFYYEHDEPSGGKPISSEAIEKFADLEGLDRIYDNGAIAIYDTAALRSLP